MDSPSRSFFHSLTLRAPMSFPCEQPAESTPIRTFEFHESISSTNDRVKELLGLPVLPQLPCLVVARTQSAGRGRGGKTWWSGAGALMLSLGYDIAALKLTRDELPLLSQATALSVLETLREALRETPRKKRPERQVVALHPPNDVYVDGRKISGILLESPTPKHVVIGIGINVNNRLVDVPREFQEELESRQITSMIEIVGTETDHAELVRSLLCRLHVNMARLEKDRASLLDDIARSQAVESTRSQANQSSR